MSVVSQPAVDEPALEVVRFRALPATAGVAVLELEGHFTAAALGRFTRVRLHADLADGRALELTPVESTGDPAPAGPVPWRGSWAVAVSALEGAGFALAVGRDLLLDLPAPDVEAPDGSPGESHVRLGREINAERRRADDATSALAAELQRAAAVAAGQAAEAARLEEAHAADSTRLQEAHANELSRTREEHAARLDALAQEHAAETGRLRTLLDENTTRSAQERATQLARVSAAHAAELERLGSEHAAAVKALDKELAAAHKAVEAERKEGADRLKAAERAAARREDQLRKTAITAPAPGVIPVPAASGDEDSTSTSALDLTAEDTKPLVPPRTFPRTRYEVAEQGARLIALGLLALFFLLLVIILGVGPF